MRSVWIPAGLIAGLTLAVGVAGCDRAPTPSPTPAPTGSGESKQPEGVPRDEAREDLLALITPHVQRLRDQIDTLKHKSERLPEPARAGAAAALANLEREYAGLKAKAEGLRTAGAESLEALGAEVREGVERLGREVQRISTDFNL